MKKLTRYHNELNTVPMRTWTPEEQNFFFAIITQVRDEGSRVVRFSKSDLLELADYTQEHNKRLHTTIRELKKKVNTISYTEYTKDPGTGFNKEETFYLFDRFSFEWSDDYSYVAAEVQVSEHFQYVVNKLEANFTQFELKQFTGIRSTYAKEMFKKLKQWRTIGKKEYQVDEFREMLQIPKSYRAKDVTKVVLTPIQEELSTYFPGLTITPVKARTKGNPITAYTFTWQAEATGTWTEGKYDKTDKPAYKSAKRKASKKETVPAHITDESLRTETPIDPEVGAEVAKRIAGLKSSGKKGQDGE